MYSKVHSSTIYNPQIRKEPKAIMSLLNKDVVCMCNGILLSHRKE